ncbi:glycosyltransferase [Cytophagales bacterium LB-30]|uniref:Glycosyltransferase n=1 Tax=Shiella aurantiaca TaxID=3058365 RepID=A0ABT8F2U8_9BACT|nr:glycosyltransferase [Shiella aurantiaca]MDN4164628.1 glycosyltransferase [Shiella aurantiaca]
MNVSFIIIGLNEGERLRACIRSVHSFARNSEHIKAFEVIYVDSQSVDDSLQIASQEGATGLLLKGQCNAARARNYGAKQAKGDILFFIDGDMELNEKAANFIFKSPGVLLNPIMNGKRIDLFYNNEGDFLYDNESSILNASKGDEFSITTGGLFIIDSWLWEKVGGMDNRLMCFEDNDLAYRIFKNTGLRVLKKDVVLARHHTVAYTDSLRFKKIVFGKYFYFKGVLYRKHFDSLTILLRLLRSDLSLVILLVSILFSFLFLSIYPLFFYFVAQAIKLVFIKKTSERVGYIKRFFYSVLIDLKILGGISFFYPKENNVD